MEQKRWKRRNLIVLGAIILMIAAVAVCALLQRKEMAPADEDAAAFLVITVAGERHDPIRLTEEARYSITRGGHVNVVAVTKDSVTMHSSTCDNQDCVLQGTVNLQNRGNRVLRNMILCLPNEVILELCTEEELAACLLDMPGYTGEDANE